MVSAGDFKNGITIQMDNGIWQIIEFQHVKPGKGAAFVRTKLKNIVSGGVVEKSFRPTDSWLLYLLTRVRRLRLIHVQVSIFQERNF